MCCFSRSVDAVAETQIFARFTAANRQAVVYQMRYQAKEPLAMILPIPTPARSAEDAVKFVNLERYPNFFKDLKRGFPVAKRGGFFGGAPVKPLEVKEVGSFIASFVPSIDDFKRLDERFRLPTETWEKLPAYHDYGFTVFQLKPDTQKTHPMAFEFPTRPKQGLFFPTVHIHDGKIHETAKFAHDLYLQLRDEMERPPRGWEESLSDAGVFMTIPRAENLVAKTLHCYRKSLHGKLKNEDTWVA